MSSPDTPSHGASPVAEQPGKRQRTRAALLDAGLKLASERGLEGISMGALAECLQMSRSGVFSHFGSRDDLQIAIVQEYYRRFEQEVFRPALAHPRGLPRLRAIFANWVERVTQEVQSGCIFISGAVEFDDRDGAVRTELLRVINIWLDAIGRTVEQAKAEGHLRPETEPQQMIFEIHGLILAVHYEARFLQKPGAIERISRGFERIVAYYSTPGLGVC